MTTSSAPPQIGQLAHVRGRRFVTLDVKAQSAASHPETHLVSLASVDDSLGDPLTVLWEAEAGAEAIDFDDLPQPEAFDDPEVLDAFLNAVRWGIVNDIDRTYLAPFRSGITIEDYQLDPLVRALQMPRANLLLADGVGLGKTIEAGLVVQEFVHRNRVQRVLILCPSSLQIQWQEEMRDKFGLDFRIVDHQAIHDIRRSQGIHVNPWSHYPRLITSYDFLKQDHVLRVFRDLLPADGRPTYPRKFGMLLVDECHNVAPGGRGLRNSQRSNLVREIGPHFEHKLFLSATPHNGFTESFTALLELLDNQRYHRGLKEINKEHLHGVTMVRRLKSDPGIEERFHRRDIEPILLSYSSAERKAHLLLQEYSRSRRASASGEDLYTVEFILKTLKKRFFSSPAAFRRTLEKHLHTLTTAAPADKSAGNTPCILKRLIDQIEAANEGLGEDSADSDELIEEAVGAATKRTPRATPEQLQMLNEMLAWARSAEMRPDTKMDALFDWLEKNIRPNGKWGNDRLLLFTEARDSQRWIWDQLARRGYAENGRMAEMYGGMPLDKREEVKQAFCYDPTQSKLRILVATDTASEGANLQTHCNKLIHWETSWRPTIMEQRNGRIDRHGQPRDVTIYHFAPHDYAQTAGRSRDELDDDLEFLFVAASKVNSIREDIGKVGPVIAAQVEEKMLGKRRGLDTSATESENQNVRRLLKAEINFADQVRKLREDFDTNRLEMNISPDNVRKVVEVGLKLAGQPKLKAETLEGVGTVYRVPAFSGIGWPQCLRGLDHPFTRLQRPIVFDPKLAHGSDQVVLAHLNHRLVAMCLALLRAQVWERDQKKLSRITVKSVPKSLIQGVAIVLHGRLLVLGKTQQRLHEELIAAGGQVLTGDDGKSRWKRFTETELKSVLLQSQPYRGSDRLLANLKARWSGLEPILRRTLDARMAERTQTLGNRLEDKRLREKSDIERILRELRVQLLAGLEQPDQLVLDITDEAERPDFRGLLQARAAQIPDEILREQAVIDARYAEPTPRLFPVCVTILLPRSEEAE